MIVSGHIVDFATLHYKSNDEALLDNAQHFKAIHLETEDKDMVGCFVVVDRKRDAVDLSTQALLSFNKEWMKLVNNSF